MTILEDAFSFSAQSPLFTSLALAVIAGVSLVLSRLYFHPLSHFPGPALAAATGWYWTYYDMFRGGMMIEQLELLHKRYGPVIRIGPNTLHFSDPKAFDSVYLDRRFTKDPAFYKAFMADDASFGCTDPKAAKARRELLGPFFSRKGVLKLENVIQESIGRFIASLSQKTNAAKPVNIHRAFLSVTLEVITTYCFAQRHNAIDHPDYSYPLVKAIQGASYGGVLLQHFPFLASLVMGVPAWFIRMIHADSAALPEFRTTLDEEVENIFKNPAALEHTEHETIYHHMLNPRAGYSKPSVKAMKEEAAILVGAGTETTGNACAIIAFHVLSDVQVYRRLKRDLADAWPDPDMHIPLEKLEKVEYLSAVIHEGLRFAHGVVTPLPRRVPESTEIAGVLVPGKTLVSMSSTFLHRNPELFPDPLTFDPERWLGMDSNDLTNYVVPFSKGPRMCLGVNLAWAELYLIIGNLFRKVDLELVNTTARDLEWGAYLLPYYRGFVKARITKVEGINQLVDM
ncbi:hypothetical protein NMY22_g7271 [Coprinellus aureogranulatus]|nr:hypothetical protein NMY22_g7271 [Coprinellus aureogranulatus]